jgi:hypothetical protein
MLFCSTDADRVLEQQNADERTKSSVIQLAALGSSQGFQCSSQFRFVLGAVAAVCGNFKWNRSSRSCVKNM